MSARREQHIKKAPPLVLYENSMVATWRSDSGLALLKPRPLTQMVSATTYGEGWVDCDLRPTIKNYNITSKHHQLIQCQKPDGRYQIFDCSLSKELLNMQKGNGDWEIIITRGQKSSL